MCHFSFNQLPRISSWAVNGLTLTTKIALCRPVEDHVFNRVARSGIINIPNHKLIDF